MSPLSMEQVAQGEGAEGVAERSVMLDLNELSAVVQLLEECRHGKDGGDYEGECPICTATDKMKSAIGVPEPGAAGKELAIRDHTHQLATRLQTFRQAHWTHWSADENQLVVDAIHRLRHYANAPLDEWPRFGKAMAQLGRPITGSGSTPEIRFAWKLWQVARGVAATAKTADGGM